LNVFSGVLTPFWRIISPFGWNSLFLEMHFLLLGINTLCLLCWCFSCFVGGVWSMAPGPVWHSGWSHLQQIDPHFQNICRIHFLMNFHVNLSVRELKLHHWCYLHCWGHTPHVQTKARIALFVRRNKRDQNPHETKWYKVMLHCGYMQVGSLLCTVALINLQEHQTVWYIAPWQITKI